MEASIFVGHSDLTQECTLQVPLKRQEDLTPHVQAKRAGKVVEIDEAAVADGQFGRRSWMGATTAPTTHRAPSPTVSNRLRFSG